MKVGNLLMAIIVSTTGFRWPTRKRSFHWSRTSRLTIWHDRSQNAAVGWGTPSIWSGNCVTAGSDSLTPAPESWGQIQRETLKVRRTHFLSNKWGVTCYPRCLAEHLWGEGRGSWLAIKSATFHRWYKKEKQKWTRCTLSSGSCTTSSEWTDSSWYMSSCYNNKFSQGDRNST